jgi:hypothetical protein
MNVSNENKNNLSNISNAGITNNASNNNIASSIGNSISSIGTNIGSSISSISNSIGIDGTSSSSSTSSGGIIGFFKKISWMTWIIIIVILGILGFNIFTYLAKGTQMTANIFENATKWFSKNAGAEVGDVAKQTVHVSGVGLKTAATGLATVADNTVAAATSPMNQNSSVTANSAISSQTPQMIPPPPITPSNTSLDTALENASTTTVQADDSYSSIQSSKRTGKSGWCLIGEDQNIRSCIEVGPNDVCMSGDIFPTNDVCVNPNLRV